MLNENLHGFRMIVMEKENNHSSQCNVKENLSNPETDWGQIRESLFKNLDNWEVEIQRETITKLRQDVYGLSSEANYVLKLIKVAGYLDLPHFERMVIETVIQYFSSEEGMVISYMRFKSIDGVDDYLRKMR